MKVLKKITPLFTTVITTADRIEEDQYKNGVIKEQKGSMNPYQKVIAVGDCVKNIKEGDIVCINPIRYAVLKHDVNSIKNDGTIKSYNVPNIEIAGKIYLKLQQQDIDYIVDEWEDEKSNVFSLKDSIIK